MKHRRRDAATSATHSFPLEAATSCSNPRLWATPGTVPRDPLTATVEHPKPHHLFWRPYAAEGPPANAEHGGRSVAAAYRGSSPLVSSFRPRTIIPPVRPHSLAVSHRRSPHANALRACSGNRSSH